MTDFFYNTETTSNKFLKTITTLLFFFIPFFYFLTSFIIPDGQINFVLKETYYSYLIFCFSIPLFFIMLNFYPYFMIMIFLAIDILLLLFFSLFIFLKNINYINATGTPTIYLNIWDFWISLLLSCIFMICYFYLAYKFKEKFEEYKVGIEVKLDNIKLKTNELNNNAIEMKKKYSAIKELINKFNFLNNLSFRFSNEFNRDIILAILKETLIKLFKPDNYFISILRNKELNINEPLYSELHPLNKVIINSFESYFQKKLSPIYITDIEKELMFDVLKSSINYKSMIIIPLIFKNNLIGTIGIFSDKINSFSQYHLRLLFYLGNIFTVTLCNGSLYIETERLAQKDGLTGLYKRWYFEEELKKEINIAGRYKKYLSIIMIDIDHFKNFNDTFGHSVGDIVLSSVSKIINQSVNETIDVAARYGGEEFIILLPAKDKKSAVDLAEKIRIDIETKIKLSKIEEKITASFGVATYPDDTNDLSKLTTLADTALYKAKNSGRNKVSVI